MYEVMVFGFAVHLAGILGDGAMVFRVKSKNSNFRIFALAACTIYSLAFVAWLIWIHVLRYRQIGKVCSGYYLDSSGRYAQDGYAIR